MALDLSKARAVRERSMEQFLGWQALLPNPDAVLQKRGEGLRVYRELLYDARVWAGVQSRKAGVLSLEREVARGTASAQAEQAVSALFDRLDMPRLISGILDAVFFGYQPLEILWTKNREIEDIAARPPEWFAFGQDNELRFLTADNPYEGEPVDPRQIFCATSGADYRNPYGEALLSRVLWPVTFKKGAWKFWVRYLERNGSPWVVARISPGKFDSDCEKTLRMLEELRQTANAVLSDDAALETLDPGGSGGIAYETLIQAADTEISTVLLGHAAAGQSVSGQLGAQDVAGEVRKDLIDGDKRIVEAALNHVIALYMQVAGFAGDAPSFRLWSEDDVDMDLANRDSHLTGALERSGLRLSRAYYQRKYGLADDEVEALPVAGDEKDGARKAFAANDVERRFTPEQAEIEALAERAVPRAAKSFAGLEEAMREAILAADSYEDAMRAVMELWPQATLDKAAALLESCMVGSFGAGYNDARTVFGSGGNTNDRET